jgi:hypothetical protein
MSPVAEAPVMTAGAKVREFTADLVVQRRHVASDGVVALDLGDLHGGELPGWEPGAHIDLLLDEGLVRQYSLCGDPREAGVWRVGVLLDPESRGGSRHVHERLHEGATVRVRGPRNHFPLVDSPRYLFIAGGIGITPILPMLAAAQRDTAFPYEPNRVRFNQLSLNDQRTALESIRKTWIGGQCTYFNNAIDDLNSRRELFSTYAHILLWTGFFLFAFFFFAQRSETPFLPRRPALLSFAAGSLILAVLCRGSGRNQQKKSSKPSPLIVKCASWFLSLPKMFLPERTESCNRGLLVSNALLVVALALLTVGTVYLLEGFVPWVPSAYKLGSIFKYLVLASGVLCGAWVEVNFFAEHIRHYASMASLFQAAGLRFDDCFNWFEQVGEASNERIGKWAVANIQSLIVAVGREALSENAEWLITHRARPLEPVSV